MGGECTFVIYDVPQEIANLLFDELLAEALRLQRIFNFYDPLGELSQLNLRRRKAVSEELRKVLQTALVYCEKTHGEYDITIGKQILQRKQGKDVTPIGCSYTDVMMDGSTVVLTHPDVLLDLGSIAKGYIADKLAEFLRGQGVTSFFIDARGDMVASGTHTERIEIMHPRDATKTVAPFILENGAVATSGDYRQFYGSFETSHILHQKDLVSVTVVARTLMEADVFASAVYLLPAEEREAFIKEHSQYKVYTISASLEQHSYNGFDSEVALEVLA